MEQQQQELSQPDEKELLEEAVRMIRGETRKLPTIDHLTAVYHEMLRLRHLVPNQEDL
jgi:hypothetical protein